MRDQIVLGIWHELSVLKIRKIAGSARSYTWGRLTWPFFLVIKSMATKAVNMTLLLVGFDGTRPWARHDSDQKPMRYTEVQPQRVGSELWCETSFGPLRPGPEPFKSVVINRCGWFESSRRPRWKIYLTRSQSPYMLRDMYKVYVISLRLPPSYHVWDRNSLGQWEVSSWLIKNSAIMGLALIYLVFGYR